MHYDGNDNDGYGRLGDGASGRTGDDHWTREEVDEVIDARAPRLYWALARHVTGWKSEAALLLLAFAGGLAAGALLAAWLLP